MAKSDQTGIFVLVAILGILLLFVAYVIGYVKPIASSLDLNQKINVYLTFVIGIFAIIEAISTYLQWAQGKIDNKIIDLRHEIETVYGELLSMIWHKVEISKFRDEGEAKRYALFTAAELSDFVDLLLKYSYIIPSSFLSDLQEGSGQWKFQAKLWMPNEYYGKIYEEYKEIVNQYRKLLDKGAMFWDI